MLICKEWGFVALISTFVQGDALHLASESNMGPKGFLQGSGLVTL